MNIYVASSWRNKKHQQAAVHRFREEGHDVYDFRDPEGAGHETGFHWSDIDPGWQDWTPDEFIAALNHDLAIVHFNMDLTAMQRADVIVMVLPCGHSAHLEAGWGTAKKHTAIWIPEACEPELMYRQAECITTRLDDVVEWLASL